MTDPIKLISKRHAIMFAKRQEWARVGYWLDIYFTYNPLCKHAHKLGTLARRGTFLDPDIVNAVCKEWEADVVGQKLSLD